MAALDILKMVVSPTIRLAVGFSPATPPAAEYRVDVVGIDIEHSLSVTGSHSPIICGALVYGARYSVTVSAGGTTGASVEVTATPSRAASYPHVLRQAVTDILADAELELDGAAVHVQRDGYGIVRPLRDDQPRGRKGPGIAVRVPQLASSGGIIGGQREDVYDVPIRLILAKRDDDDGAERLALLWDRVRETCDGVEYLGLAGAGVFDRTWSWKPPRKIKARGETHVLEGMLSVPVQVPVGQSLFA